MTTPTDIVATAITENEADIRAAMRALSKKLESDARRKARGYGTLAEVVAAKRAAKLIYSASFGPEHTETCSCADCT